MYIVPSGSIPSVNPTAPVGGTATGEEASAQLAFQLGYLELLLLDAQDPTPSPQTIPEIQSLIAQMTTEMNAPGCDPTVRAIVANSGALSILQTNGQINPSARDAFVANWRDVNDTNPQNCPSVEIYNWMNGQDNGGVPPFNIANAQDPNTMFAYLMFVAAVPTSTPMNGIDFNPFMQGGTAPSPIGWAQTAALFLQSYVHEQSNPPAFENMMNSILTLAMLDSAGAGSGTTGAAYQLYNAFASNNQFTPPPGETYAQTEAAMMMWLQQYLYN